MEASIGVFGYLVMGPLSFVYFESLFYDLKKPKPKYWLHFILPFLVFLIVSANNFSVLEAFQLGNIFLLVYLSYIGCVYFIKNKRKIVRTKWNISLYIGLISLLIAFSIQTVYSSAFAYTVGLVLASIIIYILFFIALSSPYIVKEKYKVPVSSDLLKRIELAIESERLYRTHGITISKLASALNAPEYLVSKGIKTLYNRGFKDVINHFRIQEVKSKLSDPSYADEKIENLAFDVGFNTSSAFYSAFKKETKLSPREYERVILKK